MALRNAFAEVAAEPTLRQVRDRLGGAYRAVYGTASAAPSTWTTVVEATPAVPFSIAGFVADPSTLTSIGYRQRLVALNADGTLATTYLVNTSDSAQPGWMPLRVTLPAGSRVAVQVFHSEAVAQTFDATVNWQET